MMTDLVPYEDSVPDIGSFNTNFGDCVQLEAG